MYGRSLSDLWSPTFPLRVHVRWRKVGTYPMIRLRFVDSVLGHALRHTAEHLGSARQGTHMGTHRRTSLGGPTPAYLVHETTYSTS